MAAEQVVAIAALAPQAQDGEGNYLMIHNAQAAVPQDSSAQGTGEVSEALMPQENVVAFCDPQGPDPCSASEQPATSACENASAPQRHCTDVESRLETLLEQQNLLLSRQLAVAEDSQQRVENAMHFQQPDTVLGGLDPSVRKIFKQWWSDFQAQLRCYFELRKKAAMYEERMAKEGLFRPFSQEAQRALQWPVFYRQVAERIADVEPFSADGQTQYCIEHAFQALREKHAQEAQAFVVAHHMRCVELLSAELTLAKQTEALQAKVAEWAAASTYCRPSVMQHVDRQAKAFVDLIYRQEMPKVEEKLTVEGQPCVAPALTLFVRCSCALMMLLAALVIDHDVLERVFSVFVAVLCGASLVWKDVIVRCVKNVFGDKSMQLRSPTHVIMDMWRSY